MRGKRSHSALFIENPNKDNKINRSGGRSSFLIAQRNQALIHRYYFISVNTKNRYEAIILRLSSEFYLSTIMIGKIINSNFDEISKIKKDKPGIRTLKQLHPHFDWNIDKRFI